MTKSCEKYAADFTVENYRRLLKTAKNGVREWASYRDFTAKQRFVLWRHDVDISPHRALRLAEVESEEGVSTTYFLHPHSLFYNLLEKGVSDIFRQVVRLGHDLGLHFDSEFHLVEDSSHLEEKLAWEREFLEDVFEVEIIAFSFHNPTTLQFAIPMDLKMAGMENTYSKYFQNEVEYCSDSNGYWRHKRLEDVLAAPASRSLQVLTHPEWWQEEPMPPRDRIWRCIDGRAESVRREYDRLLEKFGRENIG